MICRYCGSEMIASPSLKKHWWCKVCAEYAAPKGEVMANENPKVWNVMYSTNNAAFASQGVYPTEEAAEKAAHQFLSTNGHTHPYVYILRPYVRVTLREHPIVRKEIEWADKGL